jgi:DNA polymerase-3 subunit delta'
MAQGRHPDYHEVGVPEGRQQFPIANIREVQRKAYLKPVQADSHVFVILDVESMTLPAANCFLKTLEEPPGGCFFMLIAAGTAELPPTVVSRCAVVRFGNLKPETLCDLLQRAGVATADSRWLARRSWGSPGLAERMHQADMPGFNRELIDRLDSMSPADNFALSDWLNARADEQGGSAAQARAHLQDMLECAALYYRDMALAAGVCADDRPEVINPDIAPQAGAVPGHFLHKAGLVLQAMDRVAANANRTLTLDHLFTALAPDG